MMMSKNITKTVLLIVVIVCTLLPVGVEAYTLDIGSGGRLSDLERFLVRGVFNDNIFRTSDGATAEGDFTTEFSSDVNIKFDSGGIGGLRLRVKDKFDYTRLPEKVVNNNDFYSNMLRIDGSRRFLADKLDIRVSHALSQEPFDNTFLAHTNLVSVSMLNTRTPTNALGGVRVTREVFDHSEIDVGAPILEPLGNQISVKNFSVGMGYVDSSLFPKSKVILDYSFHMRTYKKLLFSDSRSHDLSAMFEYMLDQNWSLEVGHSFSVQHKQSGQVEPNSNLEGPDAVPVSSFGRKLEDDRRLFKNTSRLSLVREASRRWEMSIVYQLQFSSVNRITTNGTIRNLLELKNRWVLVQRITIDSSIGYDREAYTSENSALVGSLNFNWKQNRELDWSFGFTRHAQVWRAAGDLFTTTKGNLAQMYHYQNIGFNSELFVVLDEIGSFTDGVVLGGSLGTFYKVSDLSRIRLEGSVSRVTDRLNDDSTTKYDGGFSYAKRFNTWIVVSLTANHQIFTNKEAVTSVDIFRKNTYMFSLEGSFY